LLEAATLGDLAEHDRREAQFSDQAGHLRIGDVIEVIGDPGGRSIGLLRKPV
jgi:hypothetical protein